MRLLPLLLLVACSDYTLAKPDDGSSPDGAGDPGGPGDTGDFVSDSGGADSGGADTPGNGGDTGGVPGDDTGDGTPPGDDTGGGSPPGDDTGGDAPPAEDPDCEEASRTTGYLDAWQVAGDGKVVFCHREGGPSYVIINTDIDACLPHLDHTWDVFPTSGCDS